MMSRSNALYFLGLLGALAFGAWWFLGSDGIRGYAGSLGPEGEAALDLPRGQTSPNSAPVDSVTMAGVAASTDVATSASTDATSSPTALQVLRRRIADASALPVERQFLLNNQVDVPSLARQIKSEQFDLIVDQLHQQSQMDPLAHELDAIYRQAIEHQVSGDDAGLKIDRFACGLRVCIGSMRSAENTDSWSKWLTAFDLDPSTPHQVLADFTINDGAGGVSHRFLFSTDEETNAIHDVFGP